MSEVRNKPSKYQGKEKARQTDGKCKGPEAVASVVWYRNSKTVREGLEPGKQGVNYKK